MDGKITYTWSDFDTDMYLIHQKLLNSDWTPDYIVGVKRGGLIPSVKLSHILNKPLIMMSCQLRDSQDSAVRLYEVEEVPKDKNILIVDDICDSGVTLSKIILEFINNGFNMKGIKTCAVFYNNKQSFLVDYIGRTIDRSLNNKWIIFPWEAQV